MTLMTIIEAFNCFAKSTAYVPAFCAVFEPSVGTKIFEIINYPFNKNFFLHSSKQYTLCLSSLEFD